MKWCLGLAGLLFLFPDPAWAWGPATHLHFGRSVLSRLEGLSEIVRNLVSSQALPFLYGCVSADIVLAKKLGRVRTHSHRWANGLRLLEEAPTDRVKAFALGYGSHLAADAISHNCFVPAKTIESYPSGGSRHLYWELRFDQKVSNRASAGILAEISRGDFSDCDAHLAERVPTRILDFSFNKQVFNQLIAIQSMLRWQKLWDRLARQPWPLPGGEVREYTEKSAGAILNFLKHLERSKFVASDPTGAERLKAARQLRRHFRGRLRRNRPLSTRKVLRTAEAFAREPFQVIDTDRHKIG